MSEKELLYVEDVLSHLDYFAKHLNIVKESITAKDEEDIINKIMKKSNTIYEKFYDFLKGEL